MIPDAGKSIKQSVETRRWEVKGEIGCLQELIEKLEPYEGRYFRRLGTRGKTKVCEAINLYDTKRPMASARISPFGKTTSGAQYVDLVDLRTTISARKDTLRLFKLVETAEGYNEYLEAFDNLNKAFQRLQRNVDAKGISLLDVIKLFPAIQMA